MQLQHIFFSVALCNVAIAAGPISTNYGHVQGTDSRDETIEVFKGIPYAAPPVGDLRWRPPRPPKKWTTVRVCDEFGSRSLQKNDRPGQSEDCLYLNVWTSRERRETKRPVMVWIHGGGFTQGSGHRAGYDGTQLAKRGVVLVTINYRLGALGFMAHPALSAESPHGSSGNYAILDQIEALKWVRDNISNFGGDPANVTIFGESAGGTSVYLLTATPLSKGLFHRAILESPWLDPIIFRDLTAENENGPSAESEGKEQARKLFGEETSDVLEKLRAMTADDILKKIKQRWPVATDGWVFPKDPHRIYTDGDQHDVPVIVGTNRDEGTMFAPRNVFGGTLDSYQAAMAERYGEHGKRVADFYAPESKDKLWRVAVQQISDVWFIQPSREFARAMNRQNTPVWMYHFSKPVWGWMGAAHAAEIGYVFGNLENAKPDDAALSDAFMDYWVRFAKTGNPNMNGRPEWPAHTTAKDQHLVMDKTIKSDSGLRRDACDMLDQILKERRQVTNATALSDDKSRLVSGEYFITQSWSQENMFNRPYYVNVPDQPAQKSQDDKRKLPVFIFLHGNGGNAKAAMRGFMRSHKEIAARYVMVFAQGYRESWNIVSERSKADDRGFIEDIVSELATFENIDPNNFSIMGASNGAALVNQLMIESRLPNVRNYISGVSPLNVWQHDGENFKAKGADNGYRIVANPTTGKRLMNISGAEDKLVPYQGGPSKVIPAKDGKLAFVAAEESTFIWAQQMGYNGKQLTVPSSSRSNLEVFSYLSGDVVHCKVLNEGHGAVRAVSEEMLLDFLQGRENADE